jgi:hypothetical protein
MGVTFSIIRLCKALFCFSYFSDRGLTFCPRLASVYDPPTYVSHVTWITKALGLQEHATIAQLVC